ncbi:MAG: M14 family metallocarboxypeptidase [Verrucomicrobia bacterium]|nr:M14 family metallocarboxypeptidase [Verrucomicrobiota bacterium]
MNFDFHAHRVHDYAHLVQRWRKLCRMARITCEVYSEAGGFDLICVRSPRLADAGAKAIYLSAGIHGDEAASSEALLFWAELHRPILKDLPLLLFPCLNPWGLVRNQRFDAEGRDLNRCYHLDEPPQIKRQKEIITGYRFSLSLCLHEDYDAQGVYLYEVKQRQTALGQELLAAAGYHVPVDLRKTIEGRRAAQGLIARRTKHLKGVPLMAEAMFLALSHSDRTFTIETPSEYDLSARVQAHVAVIQRAIELTYRGNA